MIENVKDTQSKGQFKQHRLSVLFNSKSVKNTFQLLWFGTILIWFFLSLYWISTIPLDDPDARDFVNSSAYPLLGYSLILLGYSFYIRRQVSENLDILKSHLRSELLEEGMVEVEGFRQLFKYEKSNYLQRYYSIQVVIIVVISLGYYVTINGVQPWKLIIQLLLLAVTAIYYYRFKEDPVAVKNSIRYDRQRVSRMGGLAASLIDERNR